MKEKVRAALLSNVSNSCLVAGKLAVGLLSGSVSIISEAIHSLIDLVASFIAFLAVKKADEPADRDHRFGHGKFEDLSGFAEGVLILVAAGWIIYEAVHKLVRPAPVEHLGLGVAVMAGSAVVNLFMSGYLYRVARRENSIALEADALHLRTDVWTSAGVALGLGGIMLTGWEILDPLIALAVAVLIVRAAWQLTMRSLGHLTDAALPEEEEQRIRAIIETHLGEYLEFHELRCRTAGAELHIDLHLTMEGQRTLAETHEFCDHLESDLRKAYPRVLVLIHCEPGRSIRDEQG